MRILVAPSYAVSYGTLMLRYLPNQFTMQNLHATTRQRALSIG
jgi:hypothetical protein